MGNCILFMMHSKASNGTQRSTWLSPSVTIHVKHDEAMCSYGILKLVDETDAHVHWKRNV